MRLTLDELNKAIEGWNNADIFQLRTMIQNATKIIAYLPKDQRSAGLALSQQLRDRTKEIEQSWSETIEQRDQRFIEEDFVKDKWK